MQKQIRILIIVAAVDMVLLIVMCMNIGERGRSICGELQVGGSALAERTQQAETKFAAVTFDDGPHQEYTKQLLDGLRIRGVKATFFLTGQCIAGNEALINRMAEEGHLIGVHGMQHMDLTKMSTEEAVKELKTAGELIREITGVMPEYVRPPFGRWNEGLEEAVQRELGMVPVFWNVDSRDWELQHVGKIVRIVEEHVENGSVILYHDEFASSVEAALQTIDNMMAKGYTFVTVNELMVD